MKMILATCALAIAACGGATADKRCDSLASCGGFLIVDPTAGCPDGTGLMFSSSTTTEYPSGKQTTETSYYCVPSCDSDQDCLAGAACWHSPNGGLCVPRS